MGPETRVLGPILELGPGTRYLGSISEMDPRSKTRDPHSK